jgi:hypothetical protein
MQRGLEPFASLSNGGRVGRREIGALKRLAAGKQGIDLVQLESLDPRRSIPTNESAAKA